MKRGIMGDLEYKEKELLDYILDNDLGLDDDQAVMLIKDAINNKSKQKSKEDYPLGARAADKIAKFAGSWVFYNYFHSYAYDLDANKFKDER